MTHRLWLPALLAGFTLVTGCGGGETPEPAEPATEEPATEEPATEEPSNDGTADAGTADAAVAPDLASMNDEQKMAFLMEKGVEVYNTCKVCHQENGEGLPPSFPPLKGQKDHMGDCANHAGIVLKGLQGELVVNDVTYNGVMPPQAQLSDLEIAAVTTYVRNSWGNDYGMCLPAQVAEVRASL